MEKATLVISSDARQVSLVEQLQAQKRKVYLDPEKRLEQMLAILRRCGEIILPTPVTRLNGFFEVERLQEVIAMVSEENACMKFQVFGGAFDEKWLCFFEENHILFHDFMTEEAVLTANASITAEAALAELIQLSPYEIANNKQVVLGFGRCGKEMARVLSAIGGKVTVLARNKEQRKEARVKGYEASDLAYRMEECCGAKAIINTIPAPVVSEELIAGLCKDTVIIDLASKPGGVDFDAAKRAKIVTKHALGLPGKYETRSSGTILAKDYIRHSLHYDVCGEDTLWIYQVFV